MVNKYIAAVACSVTIKRMMLKVFAFFRVLLFMYFNVCLNDLETLVVPQKNKL